LIEVVVAVFDLTTNPFWLLRTSVRARKQDVIDALESAIADDLASEADLLRAQQVILAPNTRLGAELSWLPDLSPSRAVAIAGTLSGNPPKEIALQLLDGIVGLSRANVAADICRRYPGQTDLVDQLTKSYQDLRLADVEETINASRRIAGFSPVHTDLLKATLSKIELQHADCATVCLAECACPGRALSTVIGDDVEPGTLHFEFLEATVRAYRAWVGRRLQQIDEALQEEISSLKLQPEDVEIAKRIRAGIDLWSEWNGPVELWDQAKGLEEPRSYAICDKLRDLCLWLANEMEQRKTALEITEGLRGNFAKLPSMLKLLEEDASTLKRLVEEEGISDSLSALQRAVDLAKETVPSIQAAFVSKGFSEKSTGIVLGLYGSFQSAVAATRGTEYAEVPWKMIRSVMIELNNQDQREASERLGRDLLAIAIGKATAEFITVLQDDLRTVRSNIKWSQVDYLLKTNRRKEALPVLHALIAEQAPGDDLDKLHKLYMKLQADIAEMNRRNKQRAFKWIIGIAVVCLWIGIKSCSDDHDTSSVVPTSPSPSLQSDASPASTAPATPLESAERPTSTIDDGQEVKPPTGSGRELSRDELRYCQFQHARIARAKSLSSTNDEISNVNVAVDDFNSRCSSFKYREDDMTQVKAELSRRSSNIDQDARGLLTGSTIQ
jgi:hypothetical protein